MREALASVKVMTKRKCQSGRFVVLNGEIIGRGHNLREKEQDATLHAVKLKRFAASTSTLKLATWKTGVNLRHAGTCPMCSGVMILARLKGDVRRLRPESRYQRAFMNLLQDERFNHQVEVEQGILKTNAKPLQTFKGLRERNKQRNKK